MMKDFSKESFDILIQAGQSNSFGCGYGATDEPYVTNENIWYMHSNFTISLAGEVVSANEVVGNFGLPFAREYVKKGLLQEGRKLLIIRCAEGGTGFLGNRWNMTGDLYLRMLDLTETALSLNEQNRVVGFLWHQGENDGLLRASYEVHYQHLMALIRSVCEKFNVPELPFIAADLVQQFKEDKDYRDSFYTVSDAMRDVCRDYEHGAFIETDGLKSNKQEYGYDDVLHFSRRSCYLLGKRYFEAYCRLIHVE